MAAQVERRHSTGRRTALVVLTAAGWLVASAPLAAAAPPDHARAGGKHAQHDTVAPDGEPVERDDERSAPGRGKRADAPGQAKKPGRSGDAPGQETPPEPPPAEPAPEPSPEPGSGGTPEPAPEPRPQPEPEPAPRPEPAPVAPAPPPDRPAPPATAGERTPDATTRPVAATSSVPPPGQPDPASSPPADPWSVFDLLRGAIVAASDSAGAVGADVAGSVGTATTGAARRLASGLTPAEPNPARDLGVPVGVLALLGTYLAGSRWLDRGGLPMTITEGQGDDVQHVL